MAERYTVEIVPTGSKAYKVGDKVWLKAATNADKDPTYTWEKDSGYGWVRLTRRSGKTVGVSLTTNTGTLLVRVTATFCDGSVCQETMDLTTLIPE